MRTRAAGFTLAEMIIAMFGSVVVVGALLLSSIHLQKCLHTAEQAAANQADQHRLLDYVARDLRRAIGIASTTTFGGVNGARLGSGTLTLENGNSLLITVPGYYQNQTPGNPGYDQAWPVVAADNYVDYGTGGMHVPGAKVIFRKQFDESENCTCFVRVEENCQTVIVRNADNLQLNISVGADGKTCTVEATSLPIGASGSPATEREDVLLRNVRID